MEPWERVWIDANTYAQDLHSLINCTNCHQGQAVDDMALAHEGLIAAPAADAQTTCGQCHTDVTPPSVNSLHSTLAGYDKMLYGRSTPENHPAIETMQANHCNSCHTTCGDCHVSQPNSVGGGLLAGHTFVETPPMSQTCTACHGSRVKNEYYGLNEGYSSDVHFKARMGCVDCHTGDEIHGVAITVDHRYDGDQGPTCESCHQEQVGMGSGIQQHEVHGLDTVSCQTCHSVAYTNCVNCHVQKNTEGLPFYTIEANFMGFYLGLNPLQNAERPYRYVPLRHVPVDAESFSFYGANLLPNMDNAPTWVYATPHNIQRNTPQTASCLACHANDDLFLTADVVLPEERNANRTVIVTGAPPLPAGYVDQAQATPALGITGDQSGSFWGAEAQPTTAPSSGDFWGADGATTPVPSEAFWGDTPTNSPTTEATPTAAGDFWGS